MLGGPLMFTPRRALVLTLVLAGCSRGGGDGSSGDADSSSSSSGSGGPPAEEVRPSESCEGAPLVVDGVYSGNLRGSASDAGPGGVCGEGGPDMFVRVQVEVPADVWVDARGVGFSPRVSLALEGCGSDRDVACGAAPVEARGLGIGNVVHIAIGADPEVFAALSDAQPSPEEDDPLAFEVEVRRTRVLAAGEVCEPEGRGRCADGTWCALSAQGSVRVCTPLLGDTCVSAEDLRVELVDGVGTWTIDPSSPQTDAHLHSCTGAGTRERVLRLELPGGPPLRALAIEAMDPDVGLALRTPGCLVTDEVACAAPATEGARVVLSGLDALRLRGVRPYLFVELPSDEAPPLELQFRLVPDPQISIE